MLEQAGAGWNKLKLAGACFVIQWWWWRGSRVPEETDTSRWLTLLHPLTPGHHIITAQTNNRLDTVRHQSGIIAIVSDILPSPHSHHGFTQCLLLNDVGNIVDMSVLHETWHHTKHFVDSLKQEKAAVVSASSVLTHSLAGPSQPSQPLIAHFFYVYRNHKCHDS